MRRVAELGIYLSICQVKRASHHLEHREEALRPSTYDGADSPFVNDKTGRGPRSGRCNIASRLNWNILQAAERVIPISRSNPEAINKLRRQASGRWQSANKIGPYVMSTNQPELAPPTGARKLELEVTHQ